MKKILVVLALMFVMISVGSAISQEIESEGSTIPEIEVEGTDNRVEFYMSAPETMYILPGEKVYAQFGVQTIDSSEAMVVVKTRFLKYELFYGFHLGDSSSNIYTSWLGYDTLDEHSDLGTFYLKESNEDDSWKWYSNSEKGTNSIYLFGISFVNIAPVGTSASTNIGVNGVFEDKTFGWTNRSLTFFSQDGIRGDVNGDNEVTQEDVDLLPFYYSSWLDYNGRYNTDDLNYGRGSVLFSGPDDISTWLINVYVHDPENSILTGLGIGEMMSETAYTNVDAVTSATSVGKIAVGATITRNVSFTSIMYDNSLVIETSGDVVNVSAFLPSGEIWQDTKWTTGGRADFMVPDRNIKYQIEVVSLPGREIATSVEESIPTEFSLGQNYPNPFNPSTTIPFNLSESDYARIDVFNLAGQNVATLIDGYMSAGQHNVVWNASDQATGNYIVRMRYGDKTVSQKISFVK